MLFARNITKKGKFVEILTNYLPRIAKFLVRLWKELGDREKYQQKVGYKISKYIVKYKGQKRKQCPDLYTYRIKVHVVLNLALFASCH